MRRRERSLDTKRFELVARGGTFGLESKGWIVFGEGEKLVQGMKAERVHCPETGKLVGYQLRSAETKSSAPKPAMEVSESVLTSAEVDAVVGEHFKGGKNILGVDGGPPGRSRTADLNPQQRRLREALGMDTEDLAELSRIKLDAFNPAFGRTVVQQQSC